MGRCGADGLAAEGGSGLRVALVGNANVGKSVIFNQLTGLEQTTGNWPGKTVEWAEGTLEHDGASLRLVDLPGIYSLSAFSLEEEVARDYLASRRPDAVIDVVDATALERNLYLTLQLIELGLPMVVALNLMDEARRKGLEVDAARLEALLGVPVVPTSAVKGEGVHELVDRAISAARARDAGGRAARRAPAVSYAADVEARVGEVARLLRGVGSPRSLALKLIEGDRDAEELLAKEHPAAVRVASSLRDELEQLRGQDIPVVVASERYAAASRIAGEAVRQRRARIPLSDRLDSLAMHPVGGYLVMAGTILSLLVALSVIGDAVSARIDALFEGLRPVGEGFWTTLLWKGGVVGLYGAIGVVLGFILPFYLMLGLLEDSGYLPRMAFLMDRPFHAIGLHGKASMPLLLGFGCAVPACVGTRILESRRDRLIAAVLATLVPCSARSAVIMGLVGAYVGVRWAAVVYLIDLAIVAAAGRLLGRHLPGSSPGLIMELPSYRVPVPRIVALQAWSRMRDFVTTAFPLIIAGSLLVEGANLMHWLDEVYWALSPLTVGWLGLPAFTGVLLIFGVLRKEAALVLLASAAGTADVAAAMTPVQMVVFALVVTLYVPCIATVAVLRRELGWRGAAAIAAAEVALALLVGGVAARVLPLVL